MTIQKPKRIIISRAESGNYRYEDTGKTVELNDIAYLIKDEDVISGKTENLYFQNLEEAEKY